MGNRFEVSNPWRLASVTTGLAMGALWIFGYLAASPGNTWPFVTVGNVRVEYFDGDFELALRQTSTVMMAAQAAVTTSPRYLPRPYPSTVVRWGEMLGIPCWLVVALLLVPALLPAGPAAPPTHCCHCGYDLRATPDQCPECGRVPPRFQSRFILEHLAASG